MKKLITVMLLFAFIFITPSIFLDEVHIEAAGKTMYVNAKDNIILREKPSQNAKKLGTIKNYSAITVLSSSKGWSYVETNKTKGYVYTSALSSKKPTPTISGGLIPKAGMKLTYSPSFLSTKKEEFIVSKDPYCTYLINISSNGSDVCYSEKQSKLSMGVSGTDWGFFNLTYPMKQGQYIKDTYFDYDLMKEKYNKVLVESTSKQVKVKAGTFDNVVILKYTTGERYYFVKDIGIIKATDKKGKTVTELSSVKNIKLTTTDAVKLVQKYTGFTNDSDMIFEYDHKNNEQHYIIHVFRFVGEPGYEHTATYGWYGVDPYTGEIYDALTDNRI
ncbi:SH3 domain-containing protein [Lysinibacillus endophyticus]|uniref:SH3 domain-containing protein n=1 Tax=Ureibacillus endophyticus TaxID=1978490 RepID=UPI00209D8C00|nr:SH3 domain-containing protein [Lysinibacillus endophyticus]MCP1145914.1 SH3 domain-containing protein [Lysinibacillus endophyticus]